MSDDAVSLLDIGLTSGLAANSILEINVTANTDATTGIVFDYYGADDFKYAGLSADGNALLIGHFKSGKWIMDASFDFDVKSGKDYEMALSLKGSTADVSLKAEGANNWTAMVGYVFNAVTVDGRFGLLAKEGSASFDTVTVRTDDPFFKAESQNLLAAAAPETAVQVSALINEDLALIVDEAIERWSESGMVDGDALALLDDTSIQIIDLPETTLGMAEDNTILIDSDAAGYGWFIDQTPGEDEEFGLQNSDYELGAAESSLAYGQMDLLSVVIHEIGHLLGFENLDPDTDNLMSETLEAGTRKIPAYVSSVEDDSPSLISMDTETDSMAAETITGESVQTDSSWVTGFLMDSANKGKRNPFEPKNKFEIRLNDDEEESALI